MAHFMATWIFEGVQEAVFGASSALGWTESWYVEAADIDAAFGLVDVSQYQELRRLCLSDKYRMSFLRMAEVSETDANGLRRVKIRTLANQKGAISDFASNADGKGAQVQCAILVNLMRLPRGAGEPVHDRRFLMRGLPVSVIDGNVLKINGPYWNRFTTFFNFIGKKPTGVAVGGDVATSLGLRYQNPGVTETLLLGVDVNTANRHLISIPGNLLIAPKGTNWRIKGIDTQDAPNLNRQWTQLTDSGAATMVLGKIKKPFSDDRVTLYTGPGLATIRRVSFSYGTFDQYAVIGLRNKRTGRIFRQLRGRS